MNLIQGMMASKIAEAQVLKHVDCCLDGWLEVYRAPLDLSSELTTNTAELLHWKVEQCLMVDGVVDLMATFHMSILSADLLLHDALARLIIYPARKEGDRAIYTFTEGPDARNVNPVSRPVYGPDGRHWSDWRKVLNGN